MQSVLPALAHHLLGGEGGTELLPGHQLEDGQGPVQGVGLLLALLQRGQQGQGQGRGQAGDPGCVPARPRQEHRHPVMGRAGVCGGRQEGGGPAWLGEGVVSSLWVEGGEGGQTEDKGLGGGGEARQEGEVYSVQCTVYSVQCTVYSVQCTVYSVQCTVYSVQCTVDNFITIILTSFINVLLGFVGVQSIDEVLLKRGRTSPTQLQVHLSS